MINPGMPIPARDRNVFLAYTFFIGVVGFAIGWFIAKFVW